MLNRVTSIVLLVALLSANFSRLFVYTGFELNKKYIVTQLCENRNKPLLHCDGHCYFMKKIKQVQEKEKGSERQTQKSLFQEVFVKSSNSIKFFSQVVNTVFTPYQLLKSTPSTGIVFQPPQLA
jgi:GMP synthase PP-ATPase subunit